MCVVSMIGDFFEDRYRKAPWIFPDGQTAPSTTPYVPYIPPSEGIRIDLSGISRAEFDALKKEVEMLSGLLKEALAYDKKNQEPNCEKPEKIKLLKALAKELGVELPI